jgi:hypothetical protein
VDRPIAFEHSSGSIAIKLGSRYTFTPICFDISDEGSMVYWHDPDGGLETLIRSETLDSSLVEETLKTAEKASLEQVVSDVQSPCMNLVPRICMRDGCALSPRAMVFRRVQNGETWRYSCERS